MLNTFVRIAGSDAPDISQSWAVLALVHGGRAPKNKDKECSKSM